MSDIYNPGSGPTSTPVSIAQGGTGASTALLALSNLGALNTNASQTTLNGTTAGTVVWSQPAQGSSFKKFIAIFSGYENNTAVNQTITFTVPFVNTPIITGNNTTLTITATTTTLTITAPNSVTTFSGTVIVEGR